MFPEPNAIFQHNNHIAYVKHGAVTWHGPVLLSVDQEIFPSLMKLWILSYVSKCWRKEVSIHESKLNKKRIMQQDNIPKNTSLYTNKLLKWLSQIHSLKQMKI